MALDEDLRNLARNPILAALEPETLRQVAQGALPRTLRAGDVLFRRDEPSEGGFLLRSGSIAFDPPSHDATSRIVRPPALIGEMALITPTRRPTTATAREPATLLEIPRALFQRALSQSPRSAERLRRLVATRLRGFVNDLGELRGRVLNDLEGS
ncbi:MAG: Crp/Fnr family transcriptional regulator [Methylovirgula sp.]